MSLLVTAFILVMIATTLVGVVNNHKDISVPFTLVMLGGVIVIGIAGMFNNL